MSADPTALIGRYRTPRFRYGAIVTDAVRGDVVIVGLTDGRIPWPIGKRPGSQGRGLVVFGGLEQAIRTETAASVCHWWGISGQTVSKWRSALGIPPTTTGYIKLRREQLAPRGDAMRAKIDHADPVRNAKIAASKIGRRRPRRVIEAMRRANRGRPLSPEHRRQIGEANRRNGRRPPCGTLWTAAEDELVRTLSAAEAAKQSWRTLKMVYCRRHKLRVPDGRRR